MYIITDVACNRKSQYQKQERESDRERTKTGENQSPGYN